jgi:hypothetical protein
MPTLTGISYVRTQPRVADRLRRRLGLGRRVLGRRAALRGAGGGGAPPARTVRTADSLVDFVDGFVLGEASNPSGQFDVGWELMARIEAQLVEKVPTLRRVFGALVRDTTSTPVSGRDSISSSRASRP